VFGDNVEAGYHKFFREPAKWFTTSMFFATVGFCGIYDAAEMIAQKTGSDIFQIEEKVIDIFLAKTREKSNGIKFNVEEVPSESAAGTMAKFNRDFKEIKVYYSNQFVPLNIDIPLNKRIEIEARLQSRLTGGGMTFLNFDAPLSPEQSFSLHKKLMDMRFHGQFCINYGFTQCLDCEKVQYGIQNKCGCGSENVLNISRVVGYYAVAQHAAKSKFTEIMERRVYSSI
jgi:anaerobic ribonucleoside-triphosphate reductase